ncbi:leucine-rich repeat and calponin homology domain-containing protein 1 [Engraulis encrasicolus]|uniref:leucine-rich repeat and calponin homology domain-containing protein 1 n=1 Tax=Engraulis encrasicolus TaxID=184585 RepID=UPI002FD06F7F
MAAMATLSPETPHAQTHRDPPSCTAAGGASLCGLSGLHAGMSFNRGLERALEEASLSGRLNLSGRKLKEFPKQQNYDLTDTVEADLSRNRLCDVPPELFHWVALERLSLYHNSIRSVPDTLTSLHTLNTLNISRNQLCVLPACVCVLPLRVLNVSNNKLNSLPDALSSIHTLMELDVSCNELTSLPRHMGRLRALRELNLRRNLLCVLPDDLACVALVKLDFSCNKVSTIPTSYRKMTQLQTLILDNNPLQSPPTQVCMRGMVHIFKYLSLEACPGEKIDSLYQPIADKIDGLYQPINDKMRLSRPGTGSVEDMSCVSCRHSDSGLGSDSGDKRLSTTEPSDEDSLSLSHIIREEAGLNTQGEGLNRDDSTDHISSLSVDPDCSLQLNHQDQTHTLSSPFISYIQSRTADFDEPLRIEEDVNWSTQTQAEVQLIQQLREAVELLQDPSRANMSSGMSIFPGETACLEETLNGQQHEEETAPPKIEGDSAGLASPPFGLKPRSATPHPTTPPNTPPEAHADVFRLSKEAADPQFTMRRRMEQLKEEMELMEQLRQAIEGRLKVSLCEDLGSALSDGVVLCHLANHLRPRTINSIHVPSPAVPKLSMAKCRRNVESFLDACRKMGVPESSVCSAYDILQSRLRPLEATVRALLLLTADRDDGGIGRGEGRGVERGIGRGERGGVERGIGRARDGGREGGVESSRQRGKEGGRERGEEGGREGAVEGEREGAVESDRGLERESEKEREREGYLFLFLPLLAPPPGWQLWDLIGSCRLHLLCCLLIALLAYSITEFT